MVTLPGRLEARTGGELVGGRPSSPRAADDRERRVVAAGEGRAPTPPRAFWGSPSGPRCALSGQLSAPASLAGIGQPCPRVSFTGARTRSGPAAWLSPGLLPVTGSHPDPLLPCVPSCLMRWCERVMPRHSPPDPCRDDWRGTLQAWSCADGVSRPVALAGLSAPAGGSLRSTRHCSPSL